MNTPQGTPPVSNSLLDWLREKLAAAEFTEYFLRSTPIRKVDPFCENDTNGDGDYHLCAHGGSCFKLIKSSLMDTGSAASVGPAAGSAPWVIQFLTSCGWQADRELESEGLAIAHFFAIGKANVWTGHVRIVHGERVVKTTLLPSTEISQRRGRTPIRSLTQRRFL